MVGYTCCTTFRGDRFPGYRHTAELTVHVRGDRHGQGIGSALIEALVERARAIDLHVLVAAVDADNDGVDPLPRGPRLHRRWPACPRSAASSTAG